MAFAPGDRVHLAGLGTGTVRDTRGGGRYLVDIKGRMVLAAERDLEKADPPPRARRKSGTPDDEAPVESPHGPVSLDLHGKTVDEAIAAVQEFINDALIAGHAQVHVIHGRSGGKVKAAVHQYLRQIPSASFRLDPRNAGVTIVTFA